MLREEADKQLHSFEIKLGKEEAKCDPTLISVELYGDIMEDYLEVSFHREVKALRKDIHI